MEDLNLSVGEPERVEGDGVIREEGEAEGAGGGKPNPLGRLFFSVAEVADALCVSTTTVRQLSHQGDLRFVLIGKRMLYRRQDVAAFAESLVEDE